MKRIGSALVLSTLVTAASAGALSAQLPGIPYYPIETGLGVSVAADYGKPEGGGSAYGAAGGIGFSRFGLSAAAGVFDAGGVVGNATSVGGRVGLKLFGGGLNPVSVGAQVGVSSTSDIGTGGNRLTRVLPGAWVKVSPPLFPLKPFGQVYYVGGSNVTNKEARFAVGANFNLLLGLGFHGAYDWGDSGYVWGVGAHINLRVPSLGVPGVPGM